MLKVRRTSPFGNINAPLDSEDYAVAVKCLAQATLHSHESDRRQLEGWINILRDNDRYRLLTDEKGHSFMTWSMFCRAREPYGLGYDPVALDAVIEEARRKASPQAKAADPAVEPLAEWGEKGRGRGKAQALAADPTVAPLAQLPNRVANGHSIATGKQSSNSVERIVRRLKRDAPEVAQALARGEYPSARAAGVAAGIVKLPTVLDELRRAWRKATAEEKDAFFLWVEETRS